ncbi:MAG: hypothetical protein WCB85_10900 [Candidatus Dormiibacterota bacterium]
MFIGYIQFGGGSILLTLAAGVPLGLVSGAVLAGLSIGYMTPAEDAEDNDASG